MASPNYDLLSVRLSRMLGDVVASASTDGKVWTSARRDILLNNAIRRWMLEEAQKENINALKGYVTSESQSLSSNVVARSTYTGGVFYIISGYNATNSVFIDRLEEDLRLDIVNGRMPFLTPTTYQEYWSYEGANIRIYGAGATDSVTLHYVKDHTDMSAGASSDTVVPSQYWGIILDYALELGVQEKPDPEKYPIVQDKAQEKVPTNLIGDR